MTDLDPENDRYWDGWTDATQDMRRRLTYSGVCSDCALDRTAFAGIAAAASGYASISDERHQLTDHAVELLVKTAQADHADDQAELLGLVRTLVTDQPDVAENVLAVLVLMYAAHL